MSRLEKSMTLPDMLALPRVVLCLQARDKKQLLKQLAAIGSELSGLSERTIYNALSQREQSCATGMGNGIAIPHARFDELEDIIGVFARMKSPVDFDALDDKPVDLVFMLLSPSSADTAYIKALSAISRMMRKKDCTEVLRKAATPEQVSAIIQCAINDE